MFVVDKMKMFSSSLLPTDRVARKPSLKSVFFLLLLAGLVLPEAGRAVEPMLAAGEVQSLALKEDGTVWDLSPYGSSQPINISDVVEIAAGSNYSVALKSDGTVWAWGDNGEGQLGDGTTAKYRNVPVRTLNISDVIAIATGAEHTVALKNDGTVWAWGSNLFGQLGNGSTEKTSLPSKTVNISDVIAIAAGFYHTVALKNDGTVWTWGINDDGQLGDGSTEFYSAVPVQSINISDVASITAGFAHTAVLKNDGTVWAWGSNKYGQLGDGSTQYSTTPVQTLNISDVAAIEAGSDYTVALKSDGTVWAWGENGSGQLGDGTIGYSRVPVQSINIANVTAIAAGDKHTLVLKSDGTVWAWGNNYYGELAIGASSVALSPSQVDGILDSKDISAGNEFTVALKSDGTVWAWGSNFFGQLGDGTTEYSTAPVQTLNVSDVAAIEAGYAHTVALKNDGTVWAWGSNFSGQLGNGNTSEINPVPVQTVNISDVTAIAASNDYTVALKSDGTVWAWGSNEVGQLGDDTNEDKSTPVQAVNISDVIAIAAGEFHTAALKSDGTVWTWGVNAHGQLGDGTNKDKNKPVQAVNISDVIAIATGAYHTVALKSDGSIWVWGLNIYGQLGDGTYINKTTPVKVPYNISDVKAIEAGESYTLVLQNNGTIWAWGSNIAGQLGIGTGTGYSGNYPLPVALSNSVDVAEISAGLYHAAFLDSNDGSVWAWGSNDSGQLGTPFVPRSATPVQTLQTVALTSNFFNVYELAGPLPDPYFISGGGETYTSAQSVLIGNIITDATIIFTMDGSDPTRENGAEIASGETITLFTDTTLKAFAYKDGWTDSEIITATYTFDIPPPSIQFSSAAYTVNEYENKATITIVREGNDLINVSVNYAASDGSATAGADYTATAGLINFAPGETEKTFEIPIILDTDYNEFDETINLALSNPAGEGASLGATDSAILTIAPTPASVIQFSDLTYFAHVGQGPAKITLERTGSTDAEVTVYFFTDENHDPAGTATPGEDYVNVDSIAVTFKEGEASATAEIALLPDDKIEDDESVYLAIKTPSAGAVLGEMTSAVLSIIGQKPSTLQLSAASYSVWEHEDKVVVTITRTGGQNAEVGEVTVDYATSSGSAVGDIDYEEMSGTLTFEDGVVEKTIVIPIINDALTEDSESFTIELSNPTNLASLGDIPVATIEIKDQESGVFSFEFPSYEVGEGDGILTVKVVRSSSSSGDVTILALSKSFLGGGAIPSEDYLPVSESLVFADGETAKTFNITIIDDGYTERSASFEISIALTYMNPNFATQAAMLGLRSSAIVTIKDNEPPAFQFDGDEFITTEKSGHAKIKIERLGSLAGAAYVDFATEEGSATACTNVVNQKCADTDKSADYIPVFQTFEFAEGVTQKTVDIIILSDAQGEGSESISLKLYDVSSQVQIDSSLLTISANHQAGPGIISFASLEIEAVEKNGSVTLTLVREYGSTGEVSVRVQTVDNENFPGYTGLPDSGDFNQDYVPYSEIVTFVDTKTSIDIEIQLVDDAIAENDNIFQLRLSDPTGGAVLGNNATTDVVIVGHSEPGIFNFAKKTYKAKEAEKKVSVPITRVGTDGNVEAEVALTASEFSEKMTIPNYFGGEFSPTAFHISKIPFSEGTCEAVLSFSSLGASIEYKAMNAEGECTETVVEGAQPIFSVDGFFSNSSFKYSGIVIDSDNINIFPKNNEDPDEDFIVTVTIDSVNYVTNVQPDDLPSVDKERSSAEILVEDPEDDKPSGKSYPYKLRSNGTCFIKSLF